MTGSQTTNPIELANAIEAPERPEHQDVSATPNVPGLIQPTLSATKQAEQMSMTLNPMETRRNKELKTK